jgi:hypothetical protein
VTGVPVPPRAQQQTAQQPTARDLARRSQAAVAAKDRQAWLDLFAPDAIVADPIGPSPLDPAGHGHRGLAAIAAFYDAVIAPNEHITFEIERSYLCIRSRLRGRHPHGLPWWLPRRRGPGLLHVPLGRRWAAGRVARVLAVRRRRSAAAAAQPTG